MATRQKKQESSASDSKQANGNNVLTLNVGGKETVETLQRTLTVVTCSKLAEMFSGQQDDSLPRDTDGRVFIDYKPALFLPLLDYLRGFSCLTPNK